MIKNPNTRRPALILAGWLIDGSGGPVQKNACLHVSNGKIDAVRKVHPDDMKIPDMIDLSGCTILPGLIDAHVHLFMSGTDDLATRKHQLDAGFKDIKDAIEKHIAQHHAHGIIAVRDGGDRLGHALCYKTTFHADMKIPLYLTVAGKAWHQAGRYGGLIGRPPSGNDTLAESIMKDSEHVDYIKVVNSGLNSLVKFGHETAPQFGRRELKDAVAAADLHGLKIAVHANGKIPVEIAVESGCHSVEHGFFMGKDNLIKMAEKNISWVPTAGTMKAFAEHLRRSGRDDAVARKNLDHQLEQIHLAKKIGVRILLGTDAGSIGVHHGRAVIEELKLLMNAGFSIQEAICCATLNSARSLNLEGLGVLAPGEPATFIAVKGDPSNLPDRLTEIEGFFIQGRLSPDIKRADSPTP